MRVPHHRRYRQSGVVFLQFPRRPCWVCVNSVPPSLPSAILHCVYSGDCQRFRHLAVGMGVDLESLSEASSGAVGALLSTTILYPLDTCKTKYQAEVRAQGHQKYRILSPLQKIKDLKHFMEFCDTCVCQPGEHMNILIQCFCRNVTDVLWEAISTHKVLSLYQGLVTKNLQSFVSQFIYFYGYSYFRRLYLEKSGSKSLGTKANLIVAAAAGACTSIVTQPLDTASSKMQTSEFGKSKGLWETLSGRSWSEAFDGLGISLLLTSNPSIQYTLFDQLKQRLLNGNQTITSESAPQSLSAFYAFLLGAVSKSIATCLTYPAIRCKVMIQASDSEDETKRTQSKAPKTVANVFYTIWKREGVLGFFKGLQAQILKTVLSSALLLMIKEKISRSTWVLILALRRYFW